MDQVLVITECLDCYFWNQASAPALSRSILTERNRADDFEVLLYKKTGPK